MQRDPLALGGFGELSRDDGVGTGREHHLAGADLLGAAVEEVDPKGARADEARVAAEEVHPFRIASVGLPGGGDRVDPAEDPVPDVREADLLEGRVHSEPGPLAHGPGHLGDVDEHLRGDAPDVETGTAEDLTPLDDGEAPVGQVLGEEAVAGSATDDGDVDVDHSEAFRGRWSPAMPGVVAGSSSWPMAR